MSAIVHGEFDFICDSIKHTTMTAESSSSRTHCRFNIFDFFIVTISVIELALAGSGGVSSARGLRSLRILRSFRVLRILKLLRYLESLRKIAAVLFASLPSLAAITGLLLLFWVVFAILGLQSFGGVR